MQYVQALMYRTIYSKVNSTLYKVQCDTVCITVQCAVQKTVHRQYKAQQISGQCIVQYSASPHPIISPHKPGGSSGSVMTRQVESTAVLHGTV